MKVKELTQMLEEFKRTRSIALATKICDVMLKTLGE